MRHLYNAKPKDEDLINHAKGFERRRCGHHELEEPLSTSECFKSVIDPKGSHVNKFRYVVVCQDPAIRAYLRTIPGIPIIYLKRSVMVMEPMAGSTEQVVDRDEAEKFNMGLKGRRNPGIDTTLDRKRTHDEIEGGNDADSDKDTALDRPEGGQGDVARKRQRKAQAPNPLSMKKKKKPVVVHQGDKGVEHPQPDSTKMAQESILAETENQKTRRRRKHKRAIATETEGD